MSTCSNFVLAFAQFLGGLRNYFCDILKKSFLGPNVCKKGGPQRFVNPHVCPFYTNKKL
jgi:hypothetical protein